MCVIVYLFIFILFPDHFLGQFRTSSISLPLSRLGQAAGFRRRLNEGQVSTSLSQESSGWKHRDLVISPKGGLEFTKIHLRFKNFFYVSLWLKFKVSLKIFLRPPKGLAKTNNTLGLLRVCVLDRPNVCPPFWSSCHAAAFSTSA